MLLLHTQDVVEADFLLPPLQQKTVGIEQEDEGEDAHDDDAETHDHGKRRGHLFNPLADGKECDNVKHADNADGS